VGKVVGTGMAVGEFGRLAVGGGCRLAVGGGCREWSGGGRSVGQYRKVVELIVRKLMGVEVAVGVQRVAADNV